MLFPWTSSWLPGVPGTVAAIAKKGVNPRAEKKRYRTAAWDNERTFPLYDIVLCAAALSQDLLVS